MNYIKWFEDIRLTDTPTVGGKNASLGQMIADLQSVDVRVPPGFAVTAQAYWYYLEKNQLLEPIKKQLAQLHTTQDLATLQRVSKQVRALIEQGTVPEDLADQIKASYQELCVRTKQPQCDVAIRSSAPAEDLPGASFAGHQETYLNIRGADAVVDYCKKSMASLFTDRAIVYRVEKGFDHFKVGLSVGIQKMVRSDVGASGVAFSLDTETGFKDIVMIEGAFGLGEVIVQGQVTPDQFVVHKPTLLAGYAAIIKKKLGDKKEKMVYADDPKQPTTLQKTTDVEMRSFCLSDQEILLLARAVIDIEKRYSHLKGAWSPMDVEWAKDGGDGLLYIVQARPETVHATEQHNHHMIAYQLGGTAQERNTVAQGLSIGQKIVHGVARVVNNVQDIGAVQQGDIIVTEMTDPSWVPAMKKSAGIITVRGGRTCHAAIVSRELGIPAVVGVAQALERITTGQQITIDCSRGSVGYIYDGKVPFATVTIELDTIPQLSTAVLVNIGDPESAFSVAQLPVAGVGLARTEFIISNSIKIHPMAVVHPEMVNDKNIRADIERLTSAYPDPKTFFVDTLAQGIATIAAAFYPKQVIVRLSDFKTNEYRDLLGGQFFEPDEENPMIGWRGASRYYHPNYQEAFALECAAFKKARNEMGLPNIAIMVPFVRTTLEAQKVLQQLEICGLVKGEHDLKLIMMVEIPSNVLLLDQFSAYFDGFSIGSNDLTQLTLGVDRDSDILAPLFDERDPAVKKMLELAISAAHASKRHIGVCGQAPSDYPEIAEFLMKHGIDSLSLNPDAVLPFLLRYTKK